MGQEYFADQTFSNIDFSEEPPKKGEYENCSFISCNFSNTDLSEIQFLEVEFKDCNFSNANLNDTLFQDVSFINCKMLGLQFDTCNAFGFRAKFDTCRLNHSSFCKMSLTESSFLNSQLESVDFGEANLKKSSILNCKLNQAIFDHTNLESADLRHSVNYSIDPEMNNITGAKFSLPEVIHLLDKYRLKIDN